MSEFRALLVHRDEKKNISHEIATLSQNELPEAGEVLVAIHYSTINYKDGLCLMGKGGLVRNYPHVPGIDFAGEVVSSVDERYKPGDFVALTGWRVGEVWWGGFSQLARVRADWLVPLPAGLTCKEVMSIGTAGLSAMLAVFAMETSGIKPEMGEVLVTGASGGVGSIATVVLAERGYKVVALTGRESFSEYLKSLGASEIITRDKMIEGDIKLLDSERWMACIDAVGGEILARVLAQIKFGGIAVSVGNAAGNNLPTSVIPFILRGISLVGIDSATCSYGRRVEAWSHLSNDLQKKHLQATTQTIGLADVPLAGHDILAGKVRGRLIVDVNL